MQKQQMTIASLSFLILLTSSNLVVGQVLKTGKCPSNIQTVQDFDASKYVGLWYECEKYPDIFEAGGRCIQAEYQAINADTVSVVNTQINIFNQKQSIEGSAKIVGPGKLLVTFKGIASLAGAADYWVLSTDYENYAVVYSCTNLLFAHSEIIWVLTRARNPASDIIATAHKAVTAQNLSLAELTVTDQSKCDQ